MSIQKIIIIFSLLVLGTKTERIFAARRELDNTIRRNGKIVAEITTDSKETSDLHDYLYKTLFLQDRFSKGQPKDFAFVPQLVFRMNEHIYEAMRESSYFIFNNVVE